MGYCNNNNCNCGYSSNLTPFGIIRAISRIGRCCNENRSCGCERTSFYRSRNAIGCGCCGSEYATERSYSNNGCGCKG